MGRRIVCSCLKRDYLTVGCRGAYTQATEIVCGKSDTLSGGNPTPRRGNNPIPASCYDLAQKCLERVSGSCISQVIPKLAFGGRIRAVSDRGGEKGVAQPLVVLDAVQEALVRHLAIEVAGDVERGHHALDRTIVVVNLIFHVALLVGGIAPGKRFLYRQMSAFVQVENHRFVLCIHDRDLVRWFLLGDSLSLVKQRNAWLMEPFPQNHVEGVVVTPLVICLVFRIFGARAFVGDLVALVP